MQLRKSSKKQAKILGCSKILLIHIHPSRHCRHACHLTACSFDNRASAILESINLC